MEKLLLLRGDQCLGQTLRYVGPRIAARGPGLEEGGSGGKGSVEGVKEDGERLAARGLLQFCLI